MADQEILSVVKVLRDSDVGTDGIKTTLEKVINDISKDDRHREKYIQNELVYALRDLSSYDRSICASSLRALSLVVHGNMSAKLQLLRPMGYLQQLIKLCFAKTHQISEESHRKAIQHIHKEAVGLIRKLVLNTECMTEVASLDVIGHMIHLCGIFFDNSLHVDCCVSVSQYSPKASSFLHDLSHGKRLVGKVREMSSDASQKIVEDCKIEEMFSSDPNILSVDLYDTTTDQDIVISQELIKEGLAWPQFLTPEKEKNMFVKYQGKEEFVWADIMVTSVLDGGHFWAQIGGEVVNEKLRDIINLLRSEELPRLENTPNVGDLICVKTMVGGHQDIYRGKVLQVLSTLNETMIEVFALDYGFKNVIDAECLRGLTTLGLTEPFQARFCCVSGVQAPPCESSVLENAAGTLRNLTYQNNACRLQVLEKGGADALIKLCNVPDRGVCMQAVAALLNLSINFKTRARIGFLGGIKVLLDIIQKNFPQDIKLVGMAIGAVRNLMLDAPINRGRAAECDGLLILTHVYSTCTDPDTKQQCLGAVKNLVGNSWYLLTGDGGVDLRSIVDKKHLKPFSLAVAVEPLTYVQPYRTHRLRPGEVKPRPIEKALPSHVLKSAGNSSGEESEKGLSQEDNTDGDTGDEGQLLSPTSVSAQDVVCGTELQTSEECKIFYVQDQLVPFCEDDQHELREINCVKRLSASVVSRSACAFLNSGKGGTIYLGVKKSRVVSGVEIARKDRDRLRLGVDELLGDFKPAVRYDKYKVNFVPVTKDKHNRRTTIEFIPDTFVIEVVMEKSSNTVHSTNKKRCYFRCGTANTEFSTQEIRKWVIRDQEALYNDEIKSLKKELLDARQKLAADVL